jgi:hypothetical protein
MLMANGTRKKASHVYMCASDTSELERLSCPSPPVRAGGNVAVKNENADDDDDDDMARN